LWGKKRKNLEKPTKTGKETDAFRALIKINVVRKRAKGVWALRGKCQRIPYHRHWKRAGPLERREPLAVESETV